MPCLKNYVRARLEAHFSVSGIFAKFSPQNDLFVRRHQRQEGLGHLERSRQCLTYIGRRLPGADYSIVPLNGLKVQATQKVEHVNTIRLIPSIDNGRPFDCVRNALLQDSPAWQIMVG